MLANRKSAPERWGALPKETAAQIPQIRQTKALTEIRKEIASLELQDTHIRAELESQAGRRPDDLAAAETLLKSGGTVKDICATEPRISQEHLQRERRVLAHAIAARKQQAAHAERSTITAECLGIEPLARQYMTDVFDAFAQLEKALQRSEVLFQSLSRHGFRTDCRPPHWQLHPYELRLLYDGAGPSIATYLKARQEAWGMAKSKSKKKSRAS